MDTDELETVEDPTPEAGGGTLDDLRATQAGAYQRARVQARATVSDGLLDLADARLASEGPAALSMRRLANAAGCSTMVFYSAFGTKAGLLRVLAWREADRWIDGATTLADPDPIAWFDAVAVALGGAATARPHHRALLFDADVGTEAVAHVRAAVLEAIDRAVPGSVADGVAEAVWAGWVGALAEADPERFSQVQRGLGRLWSGYVSQQSSSS